ncbi:MAG: Zn-dependent alcohol dehydrogenase, class [Actinomycetia bacterium]|nr:Zn-dependent alcohol dehydrogenase, class [Actinomycetes bacterium]
MQAALLESAGAPMVLRDDVEIAEPGPLQVQVRVAYCGVCHSDLTVAQGGLAPMPVVLGHEATGVVERVGEGVTLLAPGDPVVLTPIAPCGRCYWCVRGEPGVCVNASSIATATFTDGTTGLSRGGAPVYRGLAVGAFAEYVLTSETGAIKVPADVPLDIACVLGCAVQTGVGAVLNTARVEPGATVLVLGLGGIGLSVVQGARVAGAAQIIASDPVAQRRATAERFGATTTIDPTNEDVVAATMALTEVGADYAFEAAGRAALVNVGLDATRAGGTTVCVGAPPIDENITIAPAVLFTAQEKKLLGCLLGSSNSLLEVPRLLSLWRAGRLDLEALITTRRPLSEINEAFDDLAAARGVRTVISL